MPLAGLFGGCRLEDAGLAGRSRADLVWTDDDRPGSQGVQGLQNAQHEGQQRGSGRGLDGEGGFATVEGLQTVARIWRPVTVDESLNWHRLLDFNHETLLALDARDEPNAQLVAGHWPYPMYPFEMKEIRGKQSELRRLQAEFPMESW